MMTAPASDSGNDRKSEVHPYSASLGPSRSFWRRNGFPLLLALILCVVGFSIIDQYGVNWDEAGGDLFFGQRYLSFFLSGDARFLDFESDPYPPGHRPDYTGAALRDRPWEHYPVGSTLASGVSYILSGQLGILDPFDGFHAVNIFLGSILLFVLFRVVDERWGFLAALTATLFLFLAPRIVYAMAVNVKDFGTMVFFSLTVLVLFNGIETASRWRILFGSFLLGLALGIKANSLFIPIVILLFLIIRGVPPLWRERRKGLVGWLVLAGGLGVLVMVLSWPYLWADPVGRFARNLQYIAMRSQWTPPSVSAPALQMILYTTPLPFLLAFIAGFFPLGRMVRRREPFAALLIAWMAVVVGRLVSPGAVNFDGVRHFLELFPPMAMVAGLGVSSIVGMWERSPLLSVGGTLKKVLVAGAFIIPMMIVVVAIHPFQIAFWNSLIGGLGGAQQANISQSSDYWASSYRQGIRWLNEHVPPDSIVVVPISGHTVKVVEPYRVRDDIRVVSLGTSRSRAEKRWLDEVSLHHPVYVMFVLRRDWANELVVDCMNRLEPEATWSVAGAPILVIYRYHPQRLTVSE